MGKYFYRDQWTGKTLPERRTGNDRRIPTTLFATLRNNFRRRKSKGRRRTDRGAYVDIYDARTWFIAITVLVLSGMDAALTGLHMVEGTAREINPIMNALIQYGGLPVFFGAKLAMTVFPLAVIIVHKEWTLGKFAARLCLWAYAVLCLYHMYLVFVLHLQQV
jgi:hypothetical protein